MPPPRPAFLRDALRGAGDLGDRALEAGETRIRLADLAAGTSLAAHRDALAGRTVLLSTVDQLAAALALVDLDGLAARIVLCPPDLKADDLPVIAARAAADCLITDRLPAPGTGPDLPAIRCGTELTSAPDDAAYGRPTEWLLLTSGTTGVPKIVQHSFAGLTAAIAPRPAGPRPVVWGTFYDMRRYGGLQIFLRGLLGTGSMVLSCAGEPVADHLHRLGRAGVSHLTGTPSHWRRALMSPAIAAIAPDYVRLSGEIADQAILDALRQAFPTAAIGHAYASTEAGVGFEVNDGQAGFPASLVGGPEAPVAMRVENGSLQIRSAGAAARYVGSADLALVDADGFVDTGDMVEERDGRFHFVGRRGGIINVGGMKVHPEEVEAVINAHPRVRMSLVQGRKNPITGAIVTAAVVLADDEAPGAVRDEIMAACRDALPPHKVPALLRFVPSLEVTAAGKLVRAYA